LLVQAFFLESQGSHSARLTRINGGNRLSLLLPVWQQLSQPIADTRISPRVFLTDAPQ
jgi:hypothetical protein